MKKTAALLALGWCLAMGPAFAADEKAPAEPVAGGQQNKMKTCNADAKTKNLKGDERRTFMKECLSAGREEKKAAMTAKHDKMKACRADAKAKDLKSAELKAFMKECAGVK